MHLLDLSDSISYFVGSNQAQKFDIIYYMSNGLNHNEKFFYSLYRYTRETHVPLSDFHSSLYIGILIISNKRYKINSLTLKIIWYCVSSLNNYVGCFDTRTHIASFECVSFVILRSFSFFFWLKMLKLLVDDSQHAFGCKKHVE